MTLREVDIDRFIDKSDAAVLRDYADKIEQGEIKHYAFTAENKDGVFMYSHASPKRANLIGLLMYHVHKLHKNWDDEQ